MFLFFKFFQKISDFFRINIIEIFIRHYRNILEFWRIFQKCLNWFSMKSLSRMTIVLPWCVFWIILLFRSMLRRRIQNPLKHLRWTVCFIMLRTRFRVNLHSIVAWMLRNPLLETGAISEELAKVDEAPVSSKEFLQATVVKIHSKTRTWHYKNSQMHRTEKYSQHSSIIKASLAKLLSVCLRTKWLWVRIPLQSSTMELFLRNSR